MVTSSQNGNRDPFHFGYTTKIFSFRSGFPLAQGEIVTLWRKKSIRCPFAGTQEILIEYLLEMPAERKAAE
jgi:hypothetical protein